MRRALLFALAVMLAALCLPGGVVADDDETALPVVRDRQGRILTDSDGNPVADKKTDKQEPDETPVEPGIISREAVQKKRDSLKPLKKRLNTRGTRTAEIEYLEALRLWAVRQDNRLKEYQKVHRAYEKLKDYRDGAAAKGDNTSRIDPRLAGMKKKMAALSEDIQLAKVELQEMTSRYQAKLKYMSQMTKSQHDTAMAVIRKMGG